MTIEVNLTLTDWHCVSDCDEWIGESYEWIVHIDTLLFPAVF
jgi:hypothetical protein